MKIFGEGFRYALVSFLKEQSRGRPGALWGFGKFGKRVLQGLLENDFAPAIILDGASSLQGAFSEEGIPIVAPPPLLEAKTHYVILASPRYSGEMEAQLLQLGYREPYDYFSFGRAEQLFFESGELTANGGYCPICENKALFVETGPWLRDEYRCATCGTIPRQRALVRALNRFVPEWRALQLHESSPSVASIAWFGSRCSGYSWSYFYEDIPLGSYRDGNRCENLENLTFPNESFDVFVTQDVFEHIFNPEKAFAEIYRVLKVGGCHVFSVPVDEKIQTRTRARIAAGEVEYLLPPDYHGNPIDNEGSLVTHEYGMDITGLMGENMMTVVMLEKDRHFGIDGEYLHIFVCKKLR